MLAWMDGEEPALGRVEAALSARPVMSWVNGVEVYYRVEGDHGRKQADDVLRELRADLDLELPGTARMVETARLKATHAIALADCFAIATAAGRGSILLTGDPEIADRTDLPCPVEDLRPSAGRG